MKEIIKNLLVEVDKSLVAHKLYTLNFYNRSIRSPFISLPANIKGRGKLRVPISDRVVEFHKSKSTYGIFKLSDSIEISDQIKSEFICTPLFTLSLLLVSNLIIDTKQYTSINVIDDDVFGNLSTALSDGEGSKLNLHISWEPVDKKDDKNTIYVSIFN